jgi:hypothetical protein
MNPSVNTQGEFFAFLETLLRRAQPRQPAGASQYVGDCYKLFVELQRRFLFQEDAAGQTVLRKGMDALLLKHGYAWALEQGFSVLTHKTGLRIVAFIPPVGM